MILKKPYAFFIKYFKIIHLIMAIFMGLLIFQTNTFLQFFNEYINSNMITTGLNLIDTYFSKLSYIYISIVLIFDFIVWFLLDYKKKKNIFYVINFVGYVSVLVFYIYLSSLLTSMSKQIIDTRLIMAIRDLVIIFFTFQTFSIFVVVSRFFGLNIKQFNFESDLKELNLAEGDNEEVEVSLDLDVNTLKSKLSLILRNYKYYFKENLRLIIPIMTVLILLLGYIIYKNINGNTTKYKQGSIFTVPNYSLKVVDTFVTSKDYKMNVISDNNSLVVVKIDIKTTNKTENFEFGKFALQIGKNKYYHTIKYSSSLSDLGNTYIKQKLTDSYTSYLLVYEVPKTQASKKKNLVYVNEISSGLFSRDTLTKVKLNSSNLDEIENNNISLNEKVEFNASYIDIKSITLKGITLSDEFQIKYNKCINDSECYSFYEPLQASYSGSYDKAILKIEVDIDSQDNSNIVNLLNSFSKISYKINGINKSVTLSKQILPTKVNSKAYYFEVPQELISAEEIIYIFSVRGNVYTYKFK